MDKADCAERTTLLGGLLKRIWAHVSDPERGTKLQTPDGEMFVADITEVVITSLNAEATRLVVESWTPERGLQRVERD